MAKEKVGVMALEDLKYYLHSQLQKYSSNYILYMVKERVRMIYIEFIQNIVLEIVRKTLYIEEWNITFIKLAKRML